MGKVTFLGVEGSGKTVLTVALVDAFKNLEDKGWFLRPDSRQAYRFLMEQIPRFGKGEFPSQTSALKKLEWTATFNGEDVRKLDVLDYPGEIYRLAFLDPEDDSNPAEFREKVAAHKEEIDEFLGHLVDSEIFFVLFNLDDAEGQDHIPENLDAVWITNACLRYLKNLPGEHRIALLLTQADRHEELKSSSMSDVLNNQLKLIAKNFPDLDVLPVSAAQLDSPHNGIHEMLNIIIGPMLEDPNLFKKLVEKLETVLVLDRMNGNEILKTIDAIEEYPDEVQSSEYVINLIADARQIVNYVKEKRVSILGNLKVPKMRTGIGKMGAEAKARCINATLKWV